jgi:hypothetical protein
MVTIGLEIAVLEEHPLAPVAALGNVMRPTRHDDASLSCHDFLPCLLSSLKGTYERIRAFFRNQGAKIGDRDQFQGPIFLGLLGGAFVVWYRTALSSFDLFVIPVEDAGRHAEVPAIPCSKPSESVSTSAAPLPT